MRISLVGPGRAGTALSLALHRAGHDIVAVAGRSPERTAEVAARFDAEPLGLADPLPAVDLVVVAVRDDAIAEVAETLAGTAGESRGVVHLSGATSTGALAPVAASGVPVGSFHPLQTLPSAEAGAARLEGAWVAVTAEEPLRTTLHELAESMGARPFDLADEHKAIYHAAAASAANFTLAALAVAAELFAAAGVPFDAAKPLVDAVVANAFTAGPRASLTGPVARGDVTTVAAQLAAIAEQAPEWEEAYRAFVAATAGVAGTADRFRELS